MFPVSDKLAATCDNETNRESLVLMLAKVYTSMECFSGMELLMRTPL